MDKIQNIKQMDEFRCELLSLYRRQAAQVVLMESDIMAKKMSEAWFKKNGFSAPNVFEPGKDVLEFLVNEEGPLIVWYEIRVKDPFFEPFMKIITTLRVKKKIDLVFCGRADDRLGLARVIKKKESKILVRPLESKTFEKKMAEFFL